MINDPLEWLQPGEAPRWSCLVAVQAIRSEGQWRHATGRLRAYLHDPLIRLEFGDAVLVEGRLDRPPTPGNPGQYDARAALARQGIDGVLFVSPTHGVVRLGRQPGAWPSQLVRAVRRRWEALLDAHFSPPHAALLRSLVLGQRAAIDDRLMRAFVETGTVHTFPVSVRQPGGSVGCAYQHSGLA
jgi:predicted membrane metal-binding protein